MPTEKKMLWFDAGPVRVGFVIEQVTMGQVLLPVLLFSRFNQSVLCTQSFIYNQR